MIDTMTLGEKQKLLPQLVAKLITFAYENGYQLTFGEALRTPEQAKLDAQKGIGIENSLHTIKLAIDLNLFKNGTYLTSTGDYKPLGDYWKTLHPLCRWGGDFKSRPDGDHFSITHEGLE
jgi:hypothetical protein